MNTIAAVLLIGLAVYAIAGVMFAIPFLLKGVKQIDPHAARGSWGFRALIFPGTIAFWPLLLRRWLTGAKFPPEERNAHRTLANKKSGGASERIHP